MYNKKMVSCVLGFMCFALTLGICVQMRTVQETNQTVSNNREENNLRAEVLRYKERYENRSKDVERAEADLEKERQNSIQNNSALQEKEEQIQQGNKIIGLAEVKGPGIKITLKDNKKDIKNALNPSDLVVHDEDILSVINELKNAGAEAISINGQRIVPTTGIICGGNIIDKKKKKVGVPFVIEAIGLPEQLAALERPYGYLDILKGYGIEVKLERSNNITIPKYSGTLTYNYVKTIK